MIPWTDSVRTMASNLTEPGEDMIRLRLEQAAVIADLCEALAIIFDGFDETYSEYFPERESMRDRLSGLRIAGFLGYDPADTDTFEVGDE